MTEYRTIRELCDIVADCPHSTPKWTSDGKIVIRNNNIKNGYIDLSNPSYTDAENYEKRIKRAIPQYGDIIITREAPMGDVGMVPKGVECCLGQRMVLLRVNEDLCDKYFFLYSLQTKYVQHQISWSEGTGTTVSNLRIPHLEQIKIPYMSIEKQKKIAYIIRCIEEKIDINKIINKNLEQQAQVIFKSWFVDFEPFNGEMPHDWIASRLGDIASIKTNSFSPVKNPDAQLEHYSIPAYDEQKYPVFESAAGVKSNKYILSKNSVMISKLNPDTKRIWRPMCLSKLAVSSTEFIIFEAFNPAYRDFVFSIIDSAAFSDWMCAHTTGSTNSRQRTAPSATLEFQVTLPDEKAITDFCAIVTPMYDAIASNICENQKLAQLRDSILPKLMSGELDVSDIDF